MPASYEPEGLRAGRRRLVWLFWAGVGVAPLAALLLLMGRGVGALRAAAVLAVLAVVMIGLSVTLRDDVTTVRDDFSETMRREVELVRADVDTLRRGVELTMHRELERVRGELEAARQDTVFRAEATRLQAVEGRYDRISGEVPSAEDFQTIEPIREEFARREAGRPPQQPLMTEQIPVDAIRADAAVRSEPVRVAAARVDDGQDSSGTTYSSSARAESSGYERYETYDGYDEYEAPASAPPAQSSGPGTELEPVSAGGRWSAPAWDSGVDEPEPTAQWHPPAWDDSEPAPSNGYASSSASYSASPNGSIPNGSSANGAANGSANGSSNGYAAPSGSYGFGRNASADTASAGTTYGGGQNGTTYGGTSYDDQSDVISGDVLPSDSSYGYDSYDSSAGWSSPTTYSLGGDALGSFGSEALGGAPFGSGNGFGSSSFGSSSFGSSVGGDNGYRSSLPELPALPSSTSDSWSQPSNGSSSWDTPSWDDSPSSWSTTPAPSQDSWSSEPYSTPSYSTPSYQAPSYQAPSTPAPASPQYPSEFELPSLDHLPTVNVRKSIGGYATTTSIGGYAAPTSSSVGGYASGGTPSSGRHSGGDTTGSAGDYGRSADPDLPSERRIFLDLPEQSYNWRG